MEHNPINFRDITWVPYQLSTLSDYIKNQNFSSSPSSSLFSCLVETCETELSTWTDYTSHLTTAETQKQAGLVERSLPLTARNRFRSTPAQRMIKAVFCGMLKTRLGLMGRQYDGSELDVPDSLPLPPLLPTPRERERYDPKALNFWEFSVRRTFRNICAHETDHPLFQSMLNIGLDMDMDIDISMDSPLPSLLRQAARFSEDADITRILSNIVFAAWALRSLAHEGQFLVLILLSYSESSFIDYCSLCIIYY